MKTVKLEGYNNFELVGYAWDNVENPIGVVQIIHGMQEHALRYNHFARFLNSQGFIVFASDLRGHGQTAIINKLPYGYSDGDIFMEIVQDQIIITEYLSKKYKLPISIFSHSFGSFVAQRYLIENAFKIRNIIFCGSTHTKSFKFKIGKMIAKIGMIFKGKKAPAKFIEKKTIKGYSKNFEVGNWISRDDKVWADYLSDEMCGKTFPNSFYYSFFKNTINNYKDLKNIPYYLPILLLSGTNDIVSGSNGLPKLFFEYGKAQKKVSLKTYLGAKHELINELNKEEVFEDIVTFFKNDKLISIPCRIK